jgi:hypothetical protein
MKNNRKFATKICQYLLANPFRPTWPTKKKNMQTTWNFKQKYYLASPWQVWLRQHSYIKEQSKVQQIFLSHAVNWHHLFITSGLNGVRVAIVATRPLFPRLNPPSAPASEAGWAPGPVRILWVIDKIFYSWEVETPLLGRRPVA